VWRSQAPSEAQSPPTDGWERITLPDLWHSHGTGFTGPLWYRVNWRNDCRDGPIALNIDRMVMAGQIFLNDSLFWQDESLSEPLSRSWNTPRYWLLPDSMLSSENTLLIRLVSAVHPGPGLGTLKLGTPEQLLPEYRKQWWQQRELFSINMTISVIMSGLFFVLWLLRRKEHAFGWFALASLLWSLIISNVLVESSWPFEQGATWDRLSLSAGVLYACAFCMFTWSFGGMHFPRLQRVLWGGSAVICLIAWWMPEQSLFALQIVSAFIYWLIFSGCCLQFLFNAWRTRLPDHLVLAFCLLAFLFISGYDMLTYLGLTSSDHDFRPLSAPLMSICMFLIVAWRFAGSLRRIEAFNGELLEAVRNARGELEQTLKREHLLEIDNVRLNERLVLTHDLHDSLGSSLMSSIILTEHSNNLRQPQFLSMLRSLRDDLRHVIDGTSSAGPLDEDSPTEWIAPLRRRFVVLFDRLGLASNWNMPAHWPLPLNTTQRLALLRFVEEALSNAIKHSGANQLSIEMQALAGGGMSLCIIDNGRGFDVAGAMTDHSGIGMRSMHARISRIGGQLQIESRSGETVLTVNLAAGA
jgi:two-component system sensor histidine kinase UhpB